LQGLNYGEGKVLIMYRKKNEVVKHVNLGPHLVKFKCTNLSANFWIQKIKLPLVGTSLRKKE